MNATRRPWTRKALRSRRGGRGAALLVFLLGATASACTCTTPVTPWFRVETHLPLMEQPIQIGEPAHEVASMKIGGKWVRVGKGQRVMATRAPGGGAVLFHGEGAWRLAREDGRIAPLGVQCAFPALHPARPVVYCAECADSTTGSCYRSIVTELDHDGRVTRRYEATEPSAPGAYSVTLVALRPDGSIVLATTGRCQLFAVGPGGTVSLDVRPGDPGCHALRDWRDALSMLEAVPLVTSREDSR